MFTDFYNGKEVCVCVCVWGGGSFTEENLKLSPSISFYTRHITFQCG